MAASPPESSLQMILVRAQLGSFQTERERKGSAMNWAEAGAGAGAGAGSDPPPGTSFVFR